MNNNMANQSDVIVIGGGISGLATAWNLAQKGKQVQLLEKSNRPGGLISTCHENGYTTEASASMLMNFRPEVDQFLVDSNIINKKALRLSDVGQNRFMIKDGQLVAIPMELKKIFKSRFWNVKSKLRMLSEWAIPKNTRPDESIDQFISRRFGKQFLEQAIEPFVAGTLASDTSLASADAVLPRLKTLERKYGSITAGILANKIKNKRTAANPEAFSFHGGMQTLIDQLASEKTFNLQMGSTVHSIEKNNEGWQVLVSKEDRNGKHRSIQKLQSRQLVLATPAIAAAKLTSSVDPVLSRLLTTIKYASMNVIHLGFNASQVPLKLNGTGFLVPKTEKVKLLGNLWMSSVFAQRAPEGKVLLTSYLGGCRSPETINWPEEKVVTEVLMNLQKYLNIRATPEMVRVNRHRSALPLYHHDYSAKTLSIKNQINQHRGLFVTANYLDGVSVRDRIYQAHKTANKMLAQLPESSSTSSSNICTDPLVQTAFDG